jgi:ribosome-associated protein
VSEAETPEVVARRAEARRALTLSKEALLNECEESFFIASGPGGQHRNKTESGVRLTHARTAMSVTATERRSQLQNREAAYERLLQGLRALATVPKKRRPTKPSLGAKRRRLDSKKRVAEKKQSRKVDW